MAGARKKRRTIRFDEQAFLLDNLHLFPNTVPAPPNSAPPTTRPVSYNHFIQLGGDEKGADVNRIMLSPFSMANALNDITPAQLSLLVPHVQLFRMMKDGTQVIYPINQTQTVDAIKNSIEGRGEDVSLESVKWMDMGKTLGRVRGNIKGEIKLHFQAFNGIFVERESQGNKIRFVDMLHTEQNKDATCSQEKILLNEGSAPRDPLKIVVGYSIPDDVNNVLFTPTFARMVGSLKQVLFVQSYQYKMDISEAGRVSVTIYFMGNKESIGASGILYDLFLAADNTLRDQIIRSEKDRLQRNMREDQNRPNEMVKIGRKKWNKESTQAGFQHALYGLTSITAGQAWASLMTLMETTTFGDDPKANVTKAKETKEEETGGRLFYVDVKPETINLYTEAKKIKLTPETDINDPEWQKKMKKIDTLRKLLNKTLKPQAVGSDKFDSQVDPRTHAKNLIKNQMRGGKKSVDKFKKTWGKKYQSSVALKPKAGHRINFFFLGDLIEAACKIIHDRPDILQGCPPSKSGKINPNQKKMWDSLRVILGSISLRDPQFSRPGQQVVEQVCLADLPISFNVFQAFWHKNVWKKGRTSYPFFTFLSDISQDLIPSAASYSLFGGTPEGVHLIIEEHRLRLPKKDALDQIWKDGKTKRVTLQDISEKRWEASGQDQGSRNKYDEYIVLQSPPKPPLFPRPDTSVGQKVAKNDELGIPTFYIGNRNGLLKKVGFENKGVPAAIKAENIARIGDGTAANLVMADLYNCDIQMFGNPVMIHGMYVYINPRSLGIPETLSKDITGECSPIFWAEAVGLGGYYMVSQVTHTIDVDNGYTTSFRAIAQQPFYGFKRFKPQAPSQNPLMGSI